MAGSFWHRINFFDSCLVLNVWQAKEISSGLKKKFRKSQKERAGGSAMWESGKSVED
jgi:hypothetical protein